MHRYIYIHTCCCQRALAGVLSAEGRLVCGRCSFDSYTRSQGSHSKLAIGAEG